MKIEFEFLQKAYNELRGYVDEACSLAYPIETGSFYLKKNYEREITIVYLEKDPTQKHIKEIEYPILYSLQNHYEEDRPFSILIDNTDKGEESFIFYHEEFFETKKQAKEKIAEIIEIANRRKKQIRYLSFRYKNDEEFFIRFNKENKIERVMSPSYFKVDDIIGNFDKSFYSFDNFIAQNEILLAEKLAMLFGSKQK